MANIIFYFTGTGNSLVVARDIANQMGETKVVSIAEAIREENINLSYERIGFVFPNYYWSMPLIVERFIKKLHFQESQYIFGVITYGGTRGMVLSQLSRSVSAQSGFLSGGFFIHMPGNYIVNYGAFHPFIQRMLFKREKRKIVTISKIVAAKKATRIIKGSPFSRLFTNWVEKTVAGFGTMARNYHVNNRCTGCGICERICPVSNIRIENRQPKWGQSCEQCMACIQWCPAQAVEYADKTSRRRRFRNPEIDVADLIMERSK